MSRRRTGVMAATVAGLLVLSSVAMATEHEDTTINSGYDEENQILILNSYSEGDECTLVTEGEHEVTYTITEDGLVEVEGITNGETGEVDTESCELDAIDVTGPVGQVNHGTFVSAIATLYDGPHRGCVISHFARSDLGKGEQQINGPVEDSGELDTSQTYTVDFTSVVADCEKNGNGEGEGTSAQGKPDWAGQGRPDWAGQGRPDSPGNSGSAPGRAGR